MQKKVFALLAATAAILTAAQAGEAAASCGGPPPATTVEFPPGSAVPGPLILAERERAIRAAVGTSELVSYRVLAMGDLREGGSWDDAPANAQSADRALARARASAVVRFLRRLRAPLRTNHVSSLLLPSRPTTSPVAGFNDRTGVIIEIGVRYRDANGIYIAC